MGKVVNLEDSPGKRAGRTRKRPSKTALVLGGGGFTGGVYEIGALRAVDLLATNSTVNDFDIYVGTSAGSFVATMLAAGITPEEMMRVLTDDEEGPIEKMSQNVLLRPNLGEYARKVAGIPLRFARIAQQLLPRTGDASAIDLGMGIAQGLPRGFYSGEGVAQYVRDALASQGLEDSFSEFDRELYLPTTDLDTGERIVLGEGEWARTPVSTAVRCSTALPIVYEPVEYEGRSLIDGGIYSTTNVDVAVQRGAKFICVVNPLVPYRNDFSGEIPGIGGESRRITEMGLPSIVNQSFRLLVHQRLHRAVDYWRERYPGVDILLLEPSPDDKLMFGTSIMDYSKRLEIARHGFESVTRKLAEDYSSYKETANRHGINISARRLRRVVKTVTEEEEEPASVWRRIFEQTTGALLRQSDAS